MRGVADRVHAAMQRVQPADAETMLDRARSEAEPDELRACHDPVLARGERGDGVVDPDR
jgi:hypothetical protein